MYLSLFNGARWPLPWANFSKRQSLHLLDSFFSNVLLHTSYIAYHEALGPHDPIIITTLMLALALIRCLCSTTQIPASNLDGQWDQAHHQVDMPFQYLFDYDVSLCQPSFISLDCENALLPPIPSFSWRTKEGKRQKRGVPNWEMLNKGLGRERQDQTVDCTSPLYPYFNKNKQKEERELLERGQGRQRKGEGGLPTLGWSPPLLAKAV